MNLVQAANLVGRVYDMNGAAMPFVTISVLTEDSSLLAGTITDDNGGFALEQHTSAAIVRASYIGYQTQCINLKLWNDSIIIHLKEDSKELDEVIVLQKAPLVERRMDKIIMNVASSPFA